MTSRFDYFLQQIIVITKVEFFLVLLLMVLIFFFHFFFQMKKSKMKSKEESLKEAFLQALREEKPHISEALLKKASPYSILVVIESLSAKVRGDIWKSISLPVVEKYLLPLARKWAMKRTILKKSFAARTFSLLPMQEEESKVMRLLQDSANIIRISASVAAAKIGTMRLLQAIVNVMVEEREEGRFFYRDAILQGNSGNLGWIREQLKLEIDPRFRLVYLDILSQVFDSDLLPYIMQDLNSEDEKLRFKALKILENFPSAIEKKKMIALVDDPSYEIRGTVVTILGRLFGLNVKESLIHGLLDPEWWVRVHAALALKSLGDGGRRILMGYPQDKFPTIFETVQYVLSLPD
ncbi:MAG: hypothetical protein WCP39_04075 [Chlamydiota bacterium]